MHIAPLWECEKENVWSNLFTYTYSFFAAMSVSPNEGMIEGLLRTYLSRWVVSVFTYFVYFVY